MGPRISSLLDLRVPHRFKQNFNDHDPQYQGSRMTLDEFFNGRDQARSLFDVLRSSIELIGPHEMLVTKSQVSFGHGKPFAWVWTPGRYLRGKSLAPLVLSLSFSEPDPSPRWKQIVQPSQGRFMHHLELRSPDEIDDEVRKWLVRAWKEVE